MPSYTPMSMAGSPYYNRYSGNDCVVWLRVRRSETGASYTGHGGNVMNPVDGTAPKAGAVGKGGYDSSSSEGHVAFVEYIDSDGTPVFSTSGGIGYGTVGVMRGPDGIAAKSSGTFKGYWYTDAYPDSGPDPGPTPTGTYVMNLCGSRPSEAGATIYTAFTSGEYDERQWAANSSISGSADDVDNKWLGIKYEGADEENYEGKGWSFNNPWNPAHMHCWALGTNPLDVYAEFTLLEKYYLLQDGVNGPGHLEGSGSSSSGYMTDFYGRPKKDSSKIMYIKPVPDSGCAFRGGDAYASDMSAYKTYPGSTSSDIYPTVYFATKINPTTWQFTDDTYYDKRKGVTSCTCTCKGLVTGRSTQNVQIGLYIDDTLVSTGDGTIIWSGLVTTSTNNIKIKAINASSYDYIDLSLISFKLSYYIYEKDDTGLGETRYLCTRYFDGTKWTAGSEKEV